MPEQTAIPADDDALLGQSAERQLSVGDAPTEDAETNATVSGMILAASSRTG